MVEAIFRKLPLFKGKQRLARFLLRDSIYTKKSIWVKGKYDCEYLLPNLIENVSFEIFINGIFEQETSDFFIDILPQNGVFLDLGANIGSISIPLCRKRPDVKLVCVEAAPWIFEFLQKNLARNNMHEVVAVNKVLFYSDEEEVNFYSPEDKFGKGSLSPVFTDKLVKVRTIKVDTLVKSLKIDKVDVIKIDVEGYEYHVFKGATELLMREDAPDILFEFADWAEENAKGVLVGASQKILKDCGYKIFYFDKDISKMKESTEIITKGFYMLFASKRN